VPALPLGPTISAVDHDPLTAEQATFLAEVGPVRPSGDQTVAQAVNLAVVESFIDACQFLGYEPVPRERGPITPSPQQSYKQAVEVAVLAQDPED
jgi:hypothetical protein